jgi:hypothetical protein
MAACRWPVEEQWKDPGAERIWKAYSPVAATTVARANGGMGRPIAPGGTWHPGFCYGDRVTVQVPPKGIASRRDGA